MDHEQLEKNFNALPSMAYVDNSDQRVPGAPAVIAIMRGEKGYYPIQTSLSASDLNEPLGVSLAQAEAMFIGSLFGWDVPGAHPDTHDKSNLHENLRTETVDKPVHKPPESDD